jgi:hypothetical protein
MLRMLHQMLKVFQATMLFKYVFFSKYRFIFYFYALINLNKINGIKVWLLLTIKRYIGSG